MTATGRVPHDRRPRRAPFLQHAAAPSVVLLVATVGAVVWANATPHGYADVWGHSVTIGVAGAAKTLELRHWVSEGLMTLFFFLVGLEVRRELTTGDLRDRRAASVPVGAAIGGMVVPAALYLAVTAGSPVARGWGVPIATDIVFAVGAVALLGARAAPGLRTVLLAIAVVDDVGAILVIAFFYAGTIEAAWLLAALGVVAGTVGLRVAGIRAPVTYLVPAVALWIATLESGIHPTIAGVALGFLVPEGAGLGTVERNLEPVTDLAVVPLFALSSAGVALGGGALRAALTSRVAWGVLAGLVVGKTLGIALGANLATRITRAPLPAGLTSRDLPGLGALGGIGFTVALFVADLAFRAPALRYATTAVLLGSLLSALLGTVLLTRTRRAA